MTDQQRPLFLPLIGRHFDAFEDGSKNVEYRVGKQWNERVVAIGRLVTLSRGYGKQRRMTGVVVSFEVIRRENAPIDPDLYPDAQTVSAIGVRITSR